MTELKALKDIQIATAKEMQCSTARYGAFSLRLNQEAINHIKELRAERRRHENHFDVDGSSCPIVPDDCEYWRETDDPWYSGCIAYWIIDEKIKWIKMFFNITDEDLK